MCSRSTVLLAELLVRTLEAAGDVGVRDYEESLPVAGREADLLVVAGVELVEGGDYVAEIEDGVAFGVGLVEDLW